MIIRLDKNGWAILPPLLIQAIAFIDSVLSVEKFVVDDKLRHAFITVYLSPGREKFTHYEL